MSKLIRSGLSAAVAACLCLASPSAGQTPSGELVEADLVSEVRSIQPGQPFWVGVRLRMQDDWHVNWKNPGDAGLPPTVEWTLPKGFSAGEIQWPFPQRFLQPEVSIFGYEDEVLLIARIVPPPFGIGDEAALKARVSWLACRDVCVPGHAELTLRLPVASDRPQPDEAFAELFGHARSSLPVAESPWRFDAKVSDDYIVIAASGPDGVAPLSDVMFFPSVPGVIDNTAAQRLDRDGNRYRLSVARSTIDPTVPERISGVLVSANGWGTPGKKALEIDVAVD